MTDARTTDSPGGEATADRRLERLAGLLDEAHDAIFVSDLEGRVTLWNRGCEALYGRSREAMLGQSAEGVLGGEPAVLAAAREAVLAEGRWEGMVGRRRADGAEVVIDARLSLLRDAGGRPLEILETGRDVTAARKAERDLRYSEYRFRNVFDAMAVSFWELDFNPLGGLLAELREQGVSDLRAHVAAHPEIVRRMMALSMVVEVNDQTVALFGGPKAALLGPVDRFWPPSSEGVFAQAVFAAVERTPRYAAECKVRRLDGTDIDALFTCCFPREGVRRGTVLVGIVDISERLAAQDALSRAQAELAHATRVAMLGELTASIAHEVNQPLAAIVTSGEAGLRWLNRPEPDLDEARTVLGRIVGEGQRASEVIARIRAMATKSAPQSAPVDLGELVEEASAILRRELAANGVALTVRAPPEPVMALGDRVQLQQVVINLMVNAIQAMSQAGVEARALRITLWAEGDAVALQVADSGPGIDPAVRETLFSAFTTTKAKGMGMGLSICRSIIEAHQGRIALEDAPGGAVFGVRLPVARAGA